MRLTFPGEDKPSRGSGSHRRGNFIRTGLGRRLTRLQGVVSAGMAQGRQACCGKAVRALSFKFILWGQPVGQGTSLSSGQRGSQGQGLASPSHGPWRGRVGARAGLELGLLPPSLRPSGEDKAWLGMKDGCCGGRGTAGSWDRHKKSCGQGKAQLVPQASCNGPAICLESAPACGVSCQSFNSKNTVAGNM